jgi:DNA-directed RNA polymerase specialized sigma24 family protein
MFAEAVLSDRHHRSLEDAFTAMAPRLWRALLLYTGNHEVADEAVAEAFTQAVGASTEIRDVQAWIWTSAFRIDRGEMGGRTEDGAELPLDIPVPEPVDGAQLIDLVRALDQVTDMQRKALILRHYMGYSNVEIARILGSSASSVGVQLFRSRRKLRRLLSEEA